MFKRLLSVALLAGLCPAAWAQVDLYVTNYLEPQEKSIKPMSGQMTTSAKLFASPGEYEPVSFALRPRERLVDVMIKSGDLTGPGTIAAGQVSVRSVEGYHGGGRNILMDLGNTWDMPAFSKELFWATAHVPADARAGTYKGKVTVTSAGKPVAALDLEIEVLPIKLLTPPWSLGFNYSNPKNPKALAAHLADMREHGMTVVAPLYNYHLPIQDSDTGELGEFLEAYIAAGFTTPVYFATPMDLTLTGLTGYGTIDSQRFQQKYIEVMRKLWAETGKHKIPVIFSIGDEFTNQGIKGVEYAGKLAKLVYEELPEICVTSDMDGYMEVMAMAPYMNIATFNNGWDGIDHHNKGRRLINKEFLQEVQKTGSIPWFVNGGSGRFPFGFFFWKMTQYGVKGKVEWYYCLGNNEQGSLVRLDGERVYPTLDYEASREGIDDLKYLVTLQDAIGRAKAAGKAEAQVKEAEALLQKIGDSIIDDWTAYTDGGERWPTDGFDVMKPAEAANIGHYNSMRRAIADQIVAIQNAVK